MIIEADIQHLWDNKRFYSRNPKRKDTFCECFGEIIERVNDGHVYTDEEAEHTKYWKYLKSYHKSWREVPISKRAYKQLRSRFYDGIKLYHDIKKNGINDPFIIKKFDDGYRQVCGNRRMVIAKILGIKKVKVLVDEGFDNNLFNNE